MRASLVKEGFHRLGRQVVPYVYVAADGTWDMRKAIEEAAPIFVRTKKRSFCLRSLRLPGNASHTNWRNREKKSLDAQGIEPWTSYTFACRLALKRLQSMRATTALCTPFLADLIL